MTVIDNSFLDIVQRLADELDYTQPTTLQNLTDSKVRQMANTVNRAYAAIWRKIHNNNESAESSVTFSTVIGQENYAIDPTLNSIDEIYVGSDPPIRILPWSEYERQYRGNGAYVLTFSGFPVVCSIYQRQLWFYPQPNAVYTVNVRGKAIFTKLSADTDVPAFIADLQGIVFEWALYLLMLYEGNPAANSQLQVAMTMLKDVQNNMRSHRAEPPGMVSVDDIEDLDALRRYYLLY